MDKEEVREDRRSTGGRRGTSDPLCTLAGRGKMYPDAGIWPTPRIRWGAALAAAVDRVQHTKKRRPRAALSWIGRRSEWIGRSRGGGRLPIHSGRSRDEGVSTPKGLLSQPTESGRRLRAAAGALKKMAAGRWEPAAALSG